MSYYCYFTRVNELPDGDAQIELVFGRQYLVIPVEERASVARALMAHPDAAAKDIERSEPLPTTGEPRCRKGSTHDTQ